MRAISDNNLISLLRSQLPQAWGSLKKRQRIAAARSWCGNGNCSLTARRRAVDNRPYIVTIKFARLTGRMRETLSRFAKAKRQVTLRLGYAAGLDYPPAINSKPHRRFATRARGSPGRLH